MKARPEVDRVLARPEVRAQLEDVKRLFAQAAVHLGQGELSEHELDATAASIVIWRIVETIFGGLDDGGPTKVESATYAYVGNVAHLELWAGIPRNGLPLTAPEMTVRWPPGRRPGRRPKGRQKLLDELREKPGMSDWRVDDRGRQLGVWTADQSDDPANKRRRIKRARQDAAN